MLLEIAIFRAIIWLLWPTPFLANIAILNTEGGSANAQWEESFFPKTSVTIVILFWLKWAGYLAVAGLNLLAQLSDRRSPYGV